MEFRLPCQTLQMKNVSLCDLHSQTLSPSNKDITNKVLFWIYAPRQDTPPAHTHKTGRNSQPGWPSAPPAEGRTARRSSGVCSLTPWISPCRQRRRSGRTARWASVAAPTPPAAGPAGRAGEEETARRSECLQCTQSTQGDAATH